MAESEGDKVVDEKDPELDGEEDEEEDEEDKSPVPVRKSSTFFAQRRIIAKQKSKLKRLKTKRENRKERKEMIFIISKVL